MLDILTKAGCFFAIIVLGFILRRVGLFREDDFRVLSQICLKITLPAATIVSLSQMNVEWSMLAITAMSFSAGLIYIGVGFLLNMRSNKEQRAFDILNLPGYNIGLFGLPLVQSFVGPVGVATASLFDVGNSVICLGGAFGIASSVKEGSGFSFKRIGKAIVSSVPLMTYIICVTMNLAGLKFPAVVISFADVIRGANTFLAMLMIGIGIKLESNKERTWQIARLLIVRYGIAAILAAVFYFVLPFALEVRKTMVLLAFTPISVAIPPFTAELKGDVGLSSSYSSATIICSMIIMTVLMAVVL